MSDEDNDPHNVAMGHISEIASDHDGEEEFGLEKWAKEAEDGRIQRPDDVNEITCGWPDGNEEIEYEGESREST